MPSPPPATDAPPELPPPGDAALYNPALDTYLETHEWTAKGWRPVDDLTPLEKYPEYVPSDTAITTLVKCSPILEVGAGSGYWADVVNEAGGDILPTDKYNTGRQTYWADVQKHTHEVVTEYPDHNVLLCHPPGFAWPCDLLDLLAETQRFIFVGEWFPGADATPDFFQRLRRDWQLTQTFPVYDWASQHARGYVFTHAKTPSTEFTRGTRALSYLAVRALDQRYDEDATKQYAPAASIHDERRF